MHVQETQVFHLWQDAPDVAVQPEQVEAASSKDREEAFQSKDRSEKRKLIVTM